jgi:membrane-associated phospholipid phosphatase
MWRVDLWAPFWPWTIWLYISEYVIFFVAMFGLQNRDLATKYFYAYMIIFIISLVVFIIYPVTFPRADFAIDPGSTSISDLALRFLRDNMDTPANCLPSLHVSSCYISALPFREQNKKTYYFMMFWSAIVSASTMTTKQHYFVDIISAIALTVAVYYFVFYRVRLK